MQSITNNIRATIIALAAVLFVATLVAIAPVANAADFFGDEGGDYGWVTDSIDQSYSPDYGGDYGWVTDSIDQSYPADYGYGDYGYGSGFGGGSFLGGSGMLGGGSFFTGGSSLPVRSTGGQTQTQAQAQSQSSNNTNVNNNIITIGAPVAQAVGCAQGMSGTYPNCYWPQPQVCPVGSTGIYPNCVYPQPQYDICPNLPGIQATLPVGYYIQNGICVMNYVQPVYPQPVQPYVTLSSVPYTGLDLGPVGTAMYWGFLVLWCLFAAYMIAVKKVQNKIAAWFIGSTGPTQEAHAHTAHAAHAHAAPAPVAPVATREFAGIDPFIAGQISRLSK